MCHRNAQSIPVERLRITSLTNFPLSLLKYKRIQCSINNTNEAKERHKHENETTIQIQNKSSKKLNENFFFSPKSKKLHIYYN